MRGDSFSYDPNVSDATITDLPLYMKQIGEKQIPHLAMEIRIPRGRAFIPLEDSEIEYLLQGRPANSTADAKKILDPLLRGQTFRVSYFRESVKIKWIHGIEDIIASYSPSNTQSRSLIDRNAA